MKKMMLGALCIVLGFAANAAQTKVQIGDLYYDLDDSTMTAEVEKGKSYIMDLKGDVKIPASVTYMSQDYAVTSIGQGAFVMCSSLESVSAPYVTSIGGRAFYGCAALESVYAPSVTSIGMNPFDSCTSLTSLTVNSAMKEDWGSKKGDYGINGTDVNPDVTFLTTPTLKWDQVAQAGWKTETTLTVSTELKSGDTTLDKDEYEYACGFYGIEAQKKPTAEDFKVVSKDAQVVKEGEIAVTKESLQAAKAETVEIVGGMVYLGVSVLSNSDITASTASWAPVKFPKDTTIYVTTDGTKLILPIPAPAQQGFMILQSGDIRAVPSGGTSSGDGPKPTDGDLALLEQHLADLQEELNHELSKGHTADPSLMADIEAAKAALSQARVTQVATMELERITTAIAK